MSTDLATRVKVLLARTAQSGAIAALSSAPEITSWLETGLELHRHTGGETCAFCNQPMPAGRLEELAQHFGAEDQRLKYDIETAIREIEAVAEQLRATALPAPTALYSELRSEFVEGTNAFDEARNALLAQLSNASTALKGKLLERSRVYEADVQIDSAPFLGAASTLQVLLDLHNAKTDSFEAKKRDARAALERHYLSTVWDQC